MARRLRFSALKASRHLREVDPVVGKLIERHGPYRLRPSDDPYGALVRSIMFQQLAGAAASAIFRRFADLYGDDGRPPSPSQLLATSDTRLRAAGLSRQKISYLRDLALHVEQGKVDFDTIHTKPDREIIDHLTAVKGVGEWTAQMFLMFHLGRPDVLPVGDLAVRKGMQFAYGLRTQPTPKRAAQIGKRWAPYRSVGSWYMWRASETVTPG